MTRVPSFTFSGGVLSKGLWGRADLNKYQTGLKRAENCVISVEGGVEKRFGTYFVGKRKLQDTAQRAKLIPWRIADDDSYMLEFGEHYIRFIRLGGYVMMPEDHVPAFESAAISVDGFMEVPTDWTAENVWELKFTFANDVMYIAHADVTVQQLQRLGLYDWSLTPHIFDAHPDWSGTVTATYHDDTTTDDNYDAEPVLTKYKVSATLSSGIETKASPAESVNADLGHKRTRVDLDWPDFTDATQYTIYKGANGIYGFIGYSETSEYTDRNFAPSYDVVPIGNQIGFEGENPRVIEFYKQRMAFAATPSAPQDIWLSRPFIFNSLRKSIPLQDDDAFKLPLVGRQRHTINHMLMLKKFLIFTDSAEWTLNTVENSALTAATADPVIETYYGAHPWLRPLSIGNRILFVQNKTGAVLDMGYEFTSDAFKADDLTRLVRDLFKNKNIIAWDYALHPQNLLFCALNDGTMNIMTYVREHEIWGWTTMTTNGKVIDVASVTEIDEEGVYLQVEREINGTKTYFVERVDINQNSLIDDMIYMDCALSYIDPHEVTAIRNSETEIEITISGHGLAEGDRIRLEVSLSEYYICEVTNVDGDVLTLAPKNQSTEFPESLSGAAATAYIMASNLTGFAHLEGETVCVLADGKVYRDLTIAAGNLNLPIAAARVHVGLAYTATVETLDIDADAVKGHFREKTVHDIALNIRESRGIKVGVDHADYELTTIDSRNSATNMYLANEVLDGVYEIPSHIEWGNSTEIMIQSDDPLPMNILNIAPDIRYGSS